jgi:hypothetical protein
MALCPLYARRVTEYVILWFLPGDLALGEATLGQQLSPAAAHVIPGMRQPRHGDWVAVRLFAHAEPRLVVQIASTCGYDFMEGEKLTDTFEEEAIDVVTGRRD